jgi:hypothetical protein
MSERVIALRLQLVELSEEIKDGLKQMTKIEADIAKFAKAGAAIPGDLLYARESLSEYLDKVKRKQTKVMQKYGEALE